MAFEGFLRKTVALIFKMERKSAWKSAFEDFPGWIRSFNHVILKKEILHNHYCYVFI